MNVPAREETTGRVHQIVPRMLVTDVDEIFPDDDENFRKFRSFIQRRRSQILLVYATGRSEHSLLHFLNEREVLPKADYHITSVGAEISRQPENSKVWTWDRLVRPNWNRNALAHDLLESHPELQLQSEIDQSDYKISFWWEGGTLEKAREMEMDMRVKKHSCRVIFSAPGFLDFIPETAGKGRAALWLAQSLMVQPCDVIAIAHQANDVEFFDTGLNVIVKSDAHPSLLNEAKRRSITIQSGGIEGLEKGLRDFNFFRSTPLVRSLVDEAFAQAIVAIRKNITPLGFSAASLTDMKDVAGTTAANYRSVWARDGMMTTVWSLDLQDKEIVECGKQTLLTLLNHQSPTGLIPTNVRIDTGEVEYSGLGGIASIDSGLWTVIGAHRYVEATQDMDFLKQYHWHLQRTMDWLSAQDVNNCGLIEIPELGDWTDLLGRSYNVLYDEALWYRALRCYANLLQMLEEKQRAADYDRWADKVKARIIESFWPTGKIDMKKEGGFSERQHTIGSGAYLLSQITPFSFNSRCDVYGNLLAYHYGILDEAQAEKLFYFLWGVGVNDPWPVKCLYPAIHMGAPDWKDYLIVNMLNLPDHYHNGGIWPFIGGLWVRFLRNLGRLELAHHELIKLAELNKLGKDREWEFTEWAHGITGRPMGMAYQAWSAASYVRTYLALEKDPESRRTED